MMSAKGAPVTTLSPRAVVVKPAIPLRKDDSQKEKRGKKQQGGKGKREREKTLQKQCS